MSLNSVLLSSSRVRNVHCQLNEASSVLACLYIVVSTMIWNINCTSPGISKAVCISGLAKRQGRSLRFEGVRTRRMFRAPKVLTTLGQAPPEKFEI